MSWSLILQAVVRRFTLQKNSHIPVGTCEDFPFRTSRLVWRCFLVPWRVVFFFTPSFRQRLAGSSDSMDSVRDTREQRCWREVAWVKWPQGGGCVFEKGVKLLQTWLYIIYIHWGFPPPTNSEIIRLFIFMKGPRPKPSLSTVNGPGIPPIYTYYIRFIQVDSKFFLHDIIQQDMP